jgi:hypothetical protein
VNVRGKLYRLAGLPTGWSLSPFYLYKFTLTFVNSLRALDRGLPGPTLGNGTKTYLRRARWRGARVFPYVDDFLLFSATEEEVLTLSQRLASLMDRLGLLHHPTKSFWTPTQVGHHMKIDIDTTRANLLTHEQLGLRMGSSSERAPRGARILERRGRTTTHYMERVEGIFRAGESF